MADRDFEIRLDALERRLADLEVYVGLNPSPAVSKELNSPVEPIAAEVPQPSAASPVEAHIEPVATIPLTTQLRELRDTARHLPPPLPQDHTPPSIHLPPPPVPESVTPVAPQRPPDPQPAQSIGLEQAIGLKWAGWIGAIVLVIGAALGIKFAYDQGWFSTIPDSAKVVLMWFAGFGLIGAGEWVYRKINRLSAVGLFGAGVAILFVVSYSGHAFYSLYARDTAFILMGCSTLVGAAVAMRGNLVSIAVLSIIGGNVAPVVLSQHVPQLRAFFEYLLMLQVVALLLAAWGRAPKWWTLRALSLCSNIFWILGLLIRQPAPTDIFAQLCFVTLSAILFHAELLVSTWRARNDPTAARATAAQPGVVFTTIVTIAFIAAVLCTLAGASDHARGIWVIVTGTACAAMGFALPKKSGTAFGALSIGYRVQAAMLLVTAIPVMLSGIGIEAGWIILAIGFAVLAAKLDLPISRWAAAITWALAVVHLGVRAANLSDESAHAVWFTIARTPIPAYLILTGFLTIAGQLVAWLISLTSSAAKPTDASGKVLSILATIVWLGAAFVSLPPLGATAMMIVAAWFMLGADVLTPKLAGSAQAAALIGLAMAKWVFVDLLAARLSNDWSPAASATILSPSMAVGLIIDLSLLALFWLRRARFQAVLQRWSGGRASERDAVLWMALLVIGLIAIGLGFEIDHAAEHAAFLGNYTVWSPLQSERFALTMLGTVAVILHLALVLKIETTPNARRAWLWRVGFIPMLLTVKFLLLDTLFHRFFHDAARATVLFNLQTITAAVLLGGLLMVRLLALPDRNSPWRQYAGYLAALLLLWTGCLEIDRCFENRAAAGTMAMHTAHMAKSVAMSVYWAVFAIVSVFYGFRFRSAPARYFGLGLFALTLLKVVFVDLADAGQGYRVLSFIGLGLLLLGTSVLYGKLSPRLLAENSERPT